jgi:hypothetical protein
MALAATKCADENGACATPKPSVVLYGTGAKWAAKETTGASITCNNATFGDPSPGTPKQCMVVAFDDLATCASEGGTCNATGLSVVAYGAGNRFKAKVVTAGAVKCTNEMFTDPAHGTAKQCRMDRLASESGGAQANSGQAASPTANALPAEFYWKGSYGRGVGTPLDACPTGKNQRGALCYDKCREGFSDHGTLTCSTDCPPGYTDTGATCHYNGDKSYSPVHWDNCHSRTAKVCAFGSCVGGDCIGGLTEDGCRDGYHKDASVCWKNISVPPGMTGSAWDPTKHLYNLAPDPMVCGGGKQADAGLCYTPCRDGYKGIGPVCWAHVPTGFVDCGAGYAKSNGICANVVFNQVLPIFLVIKDVCSLSEVPFISQACTAAGEATGLTKAARYFNVGVKDLKSVPGLSQKAEAAAKAMEKAAPTLKSLVAQMGDIKGLLKGVKANEVFTALPPKVTEVMAKLAKDPETGVKLAEIANYIRAAYYQPPYQAQGTDTEKAFGVVRDLADLLGVTVGVLSIAMPEHMATPTGQTVSLAADSFALFAGYLFTVKGQ